MLDVADKLDLAVFDRDNGIKDFTGKNAEVEGTPCSTGAWPPWSG